MQSKKLFTAKQIAEIYGLKLQAVLYMFRTNKINSIKIGIRYYADAEQLKNTFGSSPDAK